VAFTPPQPKNVTYVLNLLCYLCSEPGPNEELRKPIRKAGIQEESKDHKHVLIFILRSKAVISISNSDIMTKEERSLLEALDAALRSESVREHIRSIVVRVREQLARRTDALMSWEPFPLDVLATRLPPEIRSAWVFVLRAGAETGAERHPNSHQRMMSFEGSGDLQTGEPGNWQSNVLVSDPDAWLERRWISIPVNVWHRPVISA